MAKDITKSVFGIAGTKPLKGVKHRSFLTTSQATKPFNPPRFTKARSNVGVGDPFVSEIDLPKVKKPKALQVSVKLVEKDDSFKIKLKDPNRPEPYPGGGKK